MLLVNLLVFRPQNRRRVAGAAARLILRATGVPFRVEGLERLPRKPCIVVANHCSYIDGMAAIAALPPEFAFVIKKEMVKVPLASALLRRLGSEFVERHDRKLGAADARRVLKRAADGQSLVFFPEGTFSETRQIGPFLRGAFATAARAGLPVLLGDLRVEIVEIGLPIVAIALHGTRAVLPPGSLRLRRLPIRVEILEVLQGAEAQKRSRELIARALGEPLA